MSESLIWAAFKIGFSALGKLFPFGRRLVAERQAGQQPFLPTAKIAESLLDDALVRLGSVKTDDPLWRKVVLGFEAVITRPEQFAKTHISEWLSRPEVGINLKNMVKARVIGGPEDTEAYTFLLDTYMDNSGEDIHHAKDIVQTALAFMQASLQSTTTDTGTAALIQAGFEVSNKRFDDLGEKVDKIGAPPSFIADGVLAEHHGTDAKRALEAILKRRATPQHDTLAELEELASDLSEKGKYRSAPTSIKAEVLTWIARMAAAKGDRETAEGALQELKAFGPHDTAIIDAWLDVARGEVDLAIRHLRAREDADSRSTLFGILWQKQGVESALIFFDSLGSHLTDEFTSIGWRNVVACLAGEKRFQSVLDILRSLPDRLIIECPMLGYVQGVVYTINIVPEAYRDRIINEQYLAVTDHLLVGADVDHWRKIIAEAFNRAKLAAEEAHDLFLPSMADRWLRWLRLIDPEQREEEMVALKAELENGASAIELMDFAEAFHVAYDPAPLEKYLIRAEGLGGLSREELYAKLLLLKRTGRFEDLERFIEENWERLVREIKAAAVAGFLVETLVAYGNWRRAEEVLSERQDLFISSDIPRLRLMIDHCKGEDPTTRALENYETTGSIEDLWNLVTGLEIAKRWSDLAPYARRLFDSEPTSENAERYIHCINQTDTPEEEVVDFLDNNVELVKRSSDLQSAKAWALFHLGQVEEARKLNDKLLASRHHVNDVGLDMNIAMRVGEWERFAEILGREWDQRKELPVSLLLHLARLAGNRAPERAIQLAKEAVERDSSNPYLLLQAAGIATALARDDISMPWIHQAAIASKAGEGPVHSYTFRETVEIMKNNSDDWRRKNDLFRSGQIPLHWAAPMFNMPISRFLVAIPRQNLEEPDARKRSVIPVRSGARKQIDTASINKLALDITSIFILSELHLLDLVIDTLDMIFVSPRVMEFLLLEREKVEFHQPSRIRAAKPLLEMLLAERLSVTTKKGEDVLCSEVGEEEAALLEAAKQENGFCIHGGKLYKVGAFMDEEAQLGDLEQLLATPSAVAVTLHDEGHIGTAVFMKAKAYLDSVGGEYTGSGLTPGAPIFLDRVAAQYLSDAKVLTSLINSGRKVFIHPSAAEEWEVLVGIERHTSTMVDALESIRRSLRNGMTSGKVHLLREGRKDNMDNPRFGLSELPLLDLLEDVRQVDAVCIDDRVLNALQFFADKKGRQVSLLCTMDILDLLVKRERIGSGDRYPAIHTMRQWGFFSLPLDSDELFDLLAARSLDDNGEIKESAELRSIRENLARVHSVDVLATAADLHYLDHLWHVGYEVIRKLWGDESVSVDAAEARANWIIDYIMPDIELALRFAPNKEEKTESLAVARLIAFLLPGIVFQRRKKYAEWLEKKVVASYLPANSTVIDQAAAEIARWVITRSKEVANELRKSGRFTDDSQSTENNS